MDQNKKLLEDLKKTRWYKSRPVAIQKAIEIWMPGDQFIMDNGEIMYLLGYAETSKSEMSNDPNDVQLILTKISPSESWEECNKSENKFYVCAKHFKKVTCH
jgi:hypothetical protein